MPGTDVMVPGSDTRQGGIVSAVGHQMATADEIVAAMNQLTSLDQNTVLTPITQPQLDGQWVIATYRRSDASNPLVGLAAVTFLPQPRSGKTTWRACS